MVRIIANNGNEFYNQYIGQEFEATKNSKGVYTIPGIETKTPIMTQVNGFPVRLDRGTQWFASEVEEIPDLTGEAESGH